MPRQAIKNPYFLSHSCINHFYDIRISLKMLSILTWQPPFAKKLPTFGRKYVIVAKPLNTSESRYRYIKVHDGWGNCCCFPMCSGRSFSENIYVTANSDDNTLSFFQLISWSKISSNNIALTTPKSYFIKLLIYLKKLTKIWISGDGFLIL